MSKISKLSKILLTTGIGSGIAYGGYILYQNNLLVKQLQINEQNKNHTILDKTQITIKQIIENQNKQQAKQNKQQNIQKQDKISENNNQNKQNSKQIQNKRKNNQKKQTQNEQAKQKVQKFIQQKKNQKQNKIQIVPQQNKIQSKKQQKQSIQNIEQVKQDKQIIAYKQSDIEFFKNLTQLQVFPLFKYKPQLKKALIVADIGFTQQFQQKLIQTIKSIKRLPNGKQIQIYRVNLLDPKIKTQLKKQYGAQIKDQTIFLMKNQLDENLINIDFDMYMQYPAVMSCYLTNLKPYNNKNQEQYMKKLRKMSPNQSYLLHVFDQNQPQEKKNQRFLAAKYIQMQLALHHLDNGIKVVSVQADVLRKNKIIPEDKIRPNSLHIVRKHNEFTHANPNLYLKSDDQIIPYHLLVDIGLHTKKGDIAIQNHLSKVQTFNSMSLATPFVLAVTIDKNRINANNYQSIMNTFKQLRRSNKFPELGFVLRFGEIEYLGKDHPENNQFSVKISNVAELQNQSYAHQIKTQQELKNLGISPKQWLKQSHEYLYPHQILTEQLVTNFIQNVFENKQPQYYRSDKYSVIQNIHKIVGSNFQQEIINNNLDHFVFQYSDNCPTCKAISPLVSYINQILAPIPVQQRFDIHALNSQKNKIKGQMYSPYTPNLHYYKKEWKISGPVRIPLQTLHSQGISGLYDFCVITKILKTIDTKKFNQQIEYAKKWNKTQFLL